MTDIERSAPLTPRQIDALLAALPVDDEEDRVTPEILLVNHASWATDAVLKILEKGPEKFAHYAFWEARGSIEKEDGSFNHEALRKFAVQMIALGQYMASPSSTHQQ